MGKITQEEILKRFRAIHGDRFDYSKVEYSGMHSPVAIICNRHNLTFYQRPHEHLRKGQKCPKCLSESVSRRCSCPKEVFIDRLLHVHPDKGIDVDSICYKRKDIPIIMHCKKHGYFRMRPDCLLSGQWCPRCKADKLKKPVFGWGINDLDFVIEKNFYSKWQKMIERCHSESFQNKEPTYKGCSVCNEWQYLSNFVKWISDPKNGYRDGYALDKDILIKGNKTYSPSTCCFVPLEINNLVKLNKRQRGNLPIGVTKDKRHQKSRYGASLVTVKEKQWKQNWLGTYDTPEEAFMAYKKAKEKYIKEVAESYYSQGLIIKKVYDALMRYEVEITD